METIGAFDSRESCDQISKISILGTGWVVRRLLLLRDEGGFVLAAMVSLITKYGVGAQLITKFKVFSNELLHADNSPKLNLPFYSHFSND